MNAHDQRHHRAGLILIALAAMAWSSGGIFVRVITADLMTMLFWRGLFSGAAVFTLFFIMQGRGGLAMIQSLRWPAYAVMAASAMAMITGIGSMRFTTVADTLVIYATVPFVTAGVAWLAIGEKPSGGTMVASCVALAGVGYMLKDAAFDSSLFGKALAGGMTLGMAVMTTIMRKHQDVPMLPAMGGSAWLCAFLTFWFAAPGSIDVSDFLLCAAFGILQNGAGLAFYALGSKRVPAAEATLVAALEVPFTPLWVWLFLSETPPVNTLIGGFIVLVALFGYLAAGLRWRR